MQKSFLQKANNFYFYHILIAGFFLSTTVTYIFPKASLVLWSYTGFSTCVKTQNALITAKGQKINLGSNTYYRVPEELSFQNVRSAWEVVFVSFQQIDLK